jgi:hypothetical protein
MQVTRIGLGTLFALLLQAAVVQAGKPLLELKVGNDAYQGRSVARNEETCWLQSPDGRLTRLPLERVTEFRKVSPQFRSLSVTEARDQMSREWKGFEVAAAGSYVVAAAPGKARAYAALLDETHRAFATFFSRRDFKLTQPEFPLVALIFPTEGAFAKYCELDGMGYAPGLRGYYNPDTNRIAFFEDDAAVSLSPLQIPHGREFAPLDALDNATLADRRPGPQLPPVSAITPGSSFRDTLVHEATHQLAFNMSLHTRIGDNPRWVVEGLAMIFERNAAGGGERHGSERQRVNEERYEWFMQRTRANVLPVKDFIAADRPFGTATLDAYAESWALAFYLAERRPADYTKYLRAIQEHDPLVDYTPDERVADFQKAFGKDLDWLQVEWLRFMDGL